MHPIAWVHNKRPPARTSAARTWLGGLAGGAGWGSALAIGSPRLPIAWPYIYMAALFYVLGVEYYSTSQAKTDQKKILSSTETRSVSVSTTPSTTKY